MTELPLRSYMKNCTLPILLAVGAIASPAMAETCNTIDARYTMARTLRLAAEQRPVNVRFQTTAAGVRLPAYLRTKYPDEMTIILQHEFKQLNVKDDRFEVVVWFKGYPERLTVPFQAIKAFWDSGELKCADQ
jgi:hypothetical protein